MQPFPLDQSWCRNVIWNCERPYVQKATSFVFVQTATSSFWTISTPTATVTLGMSTSTKMPSPDSIIANWHGISDNNFCETLRKTFDLPVDDEYIYRADSFAMTLPQIREQVESGKLKYKYQAHGTQIEVRLSLFQL